MGGIVVWIWEGDRGVVGIQGLTGVRLLALRLQSLREVAFLGGAPYVSDTAFFKLLLL